MESRDGGSDVCSADLQTQEPKQRLMWYPGLKDEKNTKRAEPVRIPVLIWPDGHDEHQEAPSPEGLGNGIHNLDATKCDCRVTGKTVIRLQIGYNNRAITSRITLPLTHQIKVIISFILCYFFANFHRSLCGWHSGIQTAFKQISKGLFCLLLCHVSDRKSVV